MYQGSCIHLWTLTSSFCSMSILPSWFLLGKIAKHTSLFYLCIFQKRIQKSLKKYLWFGLFCESCGITYHSLLNYTALLYYTAYFTRKLTKVLIKALKYNKALASILKEDLRFKRFD